MKKRFISLFLVFLILIIPVLPAYAADPEPTPTPTPTTEEDPGWTVERGITRLHWRRFGDDPLEGIWNYVYSEVSSGWTQDYINFLSNLNNFDLNSGDVSYPVLWEDSAVYFIITLTNGTFNIWNDSDLKEGFGGNGCCYAYRYSFVVDGEYVNIQFFDSGYYPPDDTSDGYRGVRPVGSRFDLLDSNGALYLKGGVQEFTPPSSSGDDSGGSTSGGSVIWGEEEQQGFIGGIVNGIRDAIVGLFIPEEGYLEQWIEEIKDIFYNSSTLFTYPMTLFIDFIDRLSSLSEEEPVLSIPDVHFMGHLLIPSMTFNFNSLLENEVLSGIHSIYFLVVKALISFKLLKLIVKKFSEFGA